MRLVRCFQCNIQLQIQTRHDNVIVFTIYHKYCVVDETSIQNDQNTANHVSLCRHVILTSMLCTLSAMLAR